MKIVLSRKGFDSSSGGGPSPIVDGRPVTLPIPTTMRSATRWSDLGLADHVAAASRGRLSGSEFCHHDPMFFAEEERAMLGQCAAAQSHLVNQGIGAGDIFLFFGLFAGEDGERHHRIFGWLEVDRVEPLARMSEERLGELRAIGFPHALEQTAHNDTLWSGVGGLALTAADELRLTVPGGPLSLWRVPGFMRECGLSYHARAERWHDDGTLTAASRGQEFVCDAGEREDARNWVKDTVSAMRTPLP